MTRDRSRGLKPSTTADLMEDPGHVDVPSSHFVCVGRISLLVQDTMAGVVDDLDRCHEHRPADHGIQKMISTIAAFYLFFDCCLV